MTLLELPFPPAALSGHSERSRLSWTSSDEDRLRSGYAIGMGSCELSKLLGRSRGAIRNQAYKLGITKRDDAFSDAEIEAIKAAYSGDKLRGHIGLDALSEQMGRPKSSICKKAGDLGLTNPARLCPKKPKIDRRKYKSAEERSQAASERLRQRHRTIPHPMLGKRHPPEVLELLSAKSRAAWASKTPDERSLWTEKRMKAKLANYGSLAPIDRPHGSWKAGWREIGDKRHYFRSRWEANYARYLQWLKERGDILEWEYEPETFWFDGIKRGVRSYLPDFRVHELNGSKPLHEVKGWMDARSKTTLKRMAKYHPDATIILIRERDYNSIARQVGPLITDWERPERTDRW